MNNINKKNKKSNLNMIKTSNKSNSYRPFDKIYANNYNAKRRNNS